MTNLTERQQALLDELLKDFKGDAKDLLGSHGLIKQITERALESALEGEMTNHLGYEPNAVVGKNTGNSRNGRSRKTVKTAEGDVSIEVPRDRNGSFESAVAASLLSIYTAPTERPPIGLHGFLRLSTRGAKGDLHHQCHRVTELQSAQSHQRTRRVPA